MYLCVPHVCSAHRGQRRLWFPGTRVTDSKGDESWTRMLGQSSKCSSLLGHLSSSPVISFSCLYVNRHVKTETWLSCVYAHVCPCWGRSTSHVVPQTLSTLLFEAGSQFPRRGWRAAGICLSLHVTLELKHVPPCLAFSHGLWRLSSSPHDCMTKHFTKGALSPDHRDLTHSHLSLV